MNKTNLNKNNIFWIITTRYINIQPVAHLHATVSAALSDNCPGKSQLRQLRLDLARLDLYVQYDGNKVCRPVIFTSVRQGKPSAVIQHHLVDNWGHGEALTKGERFVQVYFNHETLFIHRTSPKKSSFSWSSVKLWLRHAFAVWTSFCNDTIIYIQSCDNFSARLLVYRWGLIDLIVRVMDHH